MILDFRLSRRSDERPKEEKLGRPSPCRVGDAGDTEKRKKKEKKKKKERGMSPTCAGFSFAGPTRRRWEGEKTIP